MDRTHEPTKTVSIGYFSGSCNQNTREKELSISLEVYGLTPLQIRKKSGVGHQMEASLEAAILLMETAIDNGCMEIEIYGDHKIAVLALIGGIAIGGEELLLLLGRANLLKSCFYACDVYLQSSQEPKLVTAQADLT